MNKKNIMNLFFDIVFLSLSLLIVIVIGWMISCNTILSGKIVVFPYLVKRFIKNNLFKIFFTEFLIFTPYICIKYFRCVIKKVFSKLSDYEKSFILISTLTVIAVIVIYGSYLTGQRFFLFTDAGLDTATQFYPTYIWEIQSIKEGSLSLWNFNWGLGCDTLTRQEWLTDPFGIITVLCGLIFGEATVRYVLVIMQVLKVILCILFCYLYLDCFSYNWKIKSIIAWTYGFNGFLMLWGQHYYFGAAVMYVVILLYVVERYLKIQNAKNLVIVALVMAAIMIYSCYFGYMMVLFGAIYSLVRIAFMNTSGKLKDYCMLLWPLVISVIIGILISGIVLLPFVDLTVNVSDRMETNLSFIGKIKRAITETFDKEYYFFLASRLVTNNMTGITGMDQEYYELPELSFSMMNLIILPQFVNIWFKDKKNIVLKCMSTGIFVFSLIFPFTSFAMCAFGTISKRWTFVLMPLFALIYAYTMREMIHKKRCSFFLLIISTVIVWFLSYWGFRHYKIEERYINSLIVFINIGFSLCCAMFCFFSKKEKYKLRAYIFGLYALIIMISSSMLEGYACNQLRYTYTPELMNDEKNDNTKEALDWIRNQDNSFYRVEKAYYDLSITGDPFTQDYYPLSMYCSSMSKELLGFYNNIYCEKPGGAHEYLVLNDNMVKKMALANVKYVLSNEPLDFEGFILMHQLNEIYIYRNKYSASCGIYFDKLIEKTQFESLDAKTKTMVLMQYLVVNDADFSTYSNNETLNIEDKIDNDNSEFNEKSTSHIQGKINNVNGKKWLMLSIPWRTGWNVYIDGIKTDAINVDYAFMAVPVSSGEHQIEIRYENPIYIYGLITSIVGVFMLIIIAAIYHKCNDVGVKSPFGA